jgi:hypothetical protein
MESLDMRLGTILLSGLLLSALATPTVVAAPPEPPEDARILRALPRVPPLLLSEVYRDDIVMVSKLMGGKWVCQVHYFETIKLPWLRLTFRYRVMHEVVLPPK